MKMQLPFIFRKTADKARAQHAQDQLYLLNQLTQAKRANTQLERELVAMSSSLYALIK